MRALDAIPEVNFVVPRLNVTGQTQPTVAEKDDFVDESALDTSVGSLHAAKDKPYLTMNDKVFAARYNYASLTP